ATRLRAASPPPLADIVRQRHQALPRVLSRQPRKQGLRPVPAPLVRTVPPRRRLRRDVRGVADAALQLAQALCRLAGAEEALLCRGADDRTRRRKTCTAETSADGPGVVVLDDAR